MYNITDISDTSFKIKKKILTDSPLDLVKMAEKAGFIHQHYQGWTFSTKEDGCFLTKTFYENIHTVNLRELKEEMRRIEKTISFQMRGVRKLYSLIYYILREGKKE